MDVNETFLVYIAGTAGAGLNDFVAPSLTVQGEEDFGTAELKVFVDGTLVTTGYTYDESSGVVHFDTDVAIGTRVELRRVTDIDVPTVVFPSVLQFTVRSLNKVLNQLFLGIQEVANEFRKALGITLDPTVGDEVYNTGGRRIVGLGTPIEPADASTKAYADSVAAEAMNNNGTTWDAKGMTIGNLGSGTDSTDAANIGNVRTIVELGNILPPVTPDIPDAPTSVEATPTYRGAHLIITLDSPPLDLAGFYIYQGGTSVLLGVARAVGGVGQATVHALEPASSVYFSVKSFTAWEALSVGATDSNTVTVSGVPGSDVNSVIDEAFIASELSRITNLITDINNSPTSTKITADLMDARVVLADNILVTISDQGGIAEEHLDPAFTIVTPGTIIADINGASTTIHGSQITTGSITSGHIETTGLDANVIKTGTLDSDRINTDTLVVKHVDAGTIDADAISVDGLPIEELRGVGGGATGGGTRNLLYTMREALGAYRRKNTADVSNVTRRGISPVLIGGWLVSSSASAGATCITQYNMDVMAGIPCDALRCKTETVGAVMTITRSHLGVSPGVRYIYFTAIDVGYEGLAGIRVVLRLYDKDRTFVSEHEIQPDLGAVGAGVMVTYGGLDIPHNVTSCDFVITCTPASAKMAEATLGSLVLTDVQAGEEPSVRHVDPPVLFDWADVYLTREETNLLDSGWSAKVSYYSGNAHTWGSGEAAQQLTDYIWSGGKPTGSTPVDYYISMLGINGCTDPSDVVLWFRFDDRLGSGYDPLFDYSYYRETSYGVLDTSVHASGSLDVTGLPGKVVGLPISLLPFEAPNSPVSSRPRMRGKISLSNFDAGVEFVGLSREGALYPPVAGLAGYQNNPASIVAPYDRLSAPKQVTGGAIDGEAGDILWNDSTGKLQVCTGGTTWVDLH